MKRRETTGCADNIPTWAAFVFAAGCIALFIAIAGLIASENATWLLVLSAAFFLMALGLRGAEREIDE